MTNAPEGAFKIPNFIDQLELAKFGGLGFYHFISYDLVLSLYKNLSAVHLDRGISTI